MAETIREMVVRLTMDAGGFRKAAEESKRQIKLLDSELRAAGTGSEAFETKTTLLKEKLAAQEKAVKNYADALKQAKTNMANAKTAQEQLAAAKSVSKLETDLKNASTAAEKTRKALQAINAEKLQGIGKAMKDFGASVQNVGRKISLYVGAPLTALGVGSYNAFKNFEDAYMSVSALLHHNAVPEEKIDEIREGVIAMSEEIPVAAKDIAEMVAAAIRAGVATDSLLDFVKAMAMLSTVTDVVGDDGTLQMAKFMNVMNEPHDRIWEVTAALTHLGSTYATTEGAILQMASRMAATGELAGFSVTEILGMAAAISSLGMEAQAGGSAASKLMKKMALAAELGGESAELFGLVMGGLTDEEFGAAFKGDPAQSMIDFFAGLGRLDPAKGESVLLMLDSMGLTEIRLSNLVATGATNAELYAETINESAQAYADGTALMGIASEKFSSVAAQDTIRMNKMENAMADVGENIADAVEPLKKALDGLLESFGNLSEADQDKLVKIVAALIIMGPALQTIGGATKGVGSVVESLGKMAANKDKIISVISGIASSPITWTIAAGVGLAMLVKAIDDIPSDTERILSSLANIEIKVDEDSKNKTLAAIAEVRNAAEGLSGDRAAELEGTAAAVRAGYGTEGMFGQAIEFERQKAEQAMTGLGREFGSLVDEKNKQIAAAVESGDKAAADKLAGERDVLQGTWDAQVVAAKDAYTAAVGALVSGMMEAQPEAKAALERASRDYDLLGMLAAINAAVLSDADEEAVEALSKQLLDAAVAAGYITEAGALDAPLITLMADLENAIAKQMAEDTSTVNRGALAYTLFSAMLDADGVVDMLDLTKTQGVLDGIVESLDYKQAVDKAKNDGSISEFGQHLTIGLADGITAHADTVGDTMDMVQSKVVERLRSAFKMQSPSLLMYAEGLNIPAGLAQGIAAGAAMVDAAMQQMQSKLVSQAALTARLMSEAFARNLRLHASYTQSGGAGQTNINFGAVNVKDKTDAAVIAAQIAAITRSRQSGVGVRQ